MNPNETGPSPATPLAGGGRPGVSRRELLRITGMSAVALGGSGLLSACGVGGKATSGTPSSSGVGAYWSGKKRTGQLTWANWPLYLDVKKGNKNEHPSLQRFEKQSGIEVAYREVIQTNPSFFAKIQPTLESGDYTGYDLAVVSNGIVLTKLMSLGYLVPLDHDRLPNFAKYAADIYKDPSYDPGNTYTIPYQAGFSGLAYDPEKTGGEITSFEDLLNPKYKGKVGMFANAEELANAAMFALGIDAEKSTRSDWEKAQKWLQKVKPNVRKYYEQDYIQALVHGDVWVSQAWSGDVFQSNLSGSNLKFVIPKEGGLIWTDNFLILKHAKNPVSAISLMDYYYQPKVAAMVTEYVNYITPVPKAQQVIERDAAKASAGDAKYLKQVAHSPAVFPTKAEYAKVSPGRTVKVDEIDTFNSIFEPIYQS